MQMQLLIGDLSGSCVTCQAVQYLKGSKPRHYIFMWIAVVLRVEIRPLRQPWHAPYILSVIRSTQQLMGSFPTAGVSTQIKR
jgi:hypothetical protein